MKDSTLLTILISFYNAEKHIVSCIKDLKAQTNADFYCIIVDDGSSDKSHEYAADEIKDDGRFTLIRHKQNLGLGAGRETGIRNTQTKYLTFIDADDQLKVDAVEKILNAIRTQESDLYIFDYFKKNERNEVRRISGNAKSAVEMFPANDSRISHVWHKVYKTSLFSNFDFSFYRTVSFAEDLYICIHCLMNSRKTLLIPDAYYYYVYNENSIVHSHTEKNIRENIAILKKLLAQENLKHFPEIEAYIKNDSFHAFGQLIFPNKKNPFQWNTPHFDEWRNINAEKEVFIPKATSYFVKIYLKCITKSYDFVARILWNILKAKCLLRK